MKETNSKYSIGQLGGQFDAFEFREMKILLGKTQQRTRALCEQ